MRKIAAYTFMPVSDVTTALPPSRSWLPTRILVTKAKSMNTRCAAVPYRALIISRKVWHRGAFCFVLQAKTENIKICTVAPAAYQKGPATPYVYATCLQ